jgi:thiol-disulfide isomerase/thioredoxin
MGALQAFLLALAVAGGEETVLLDFYSDHCPPCRAMQPAVQQLAARGYPIRKVNVEREPALAAQFGVPGVPCFVMLANGREVDRVVGSASQGRLEQMLAKARTRRPADPPPAEWASAESASSGSMPIPAVQTDATFATTPPSGLKGEPPAATVAPAAAPSSASAATALDELESRLISSTVRLRIEDAGGHSCGSGTIIDARNGEALVLTCGHLFRDSQGKGRIEVDLFGPTPVQGLLGRLVHYDLEKDLGLLSIRVPGPVQAARLAPTGYRIAKGARVVNVGCNNGGPPTARQSHVTAIDRFLGPANIVASGLPVQGRSGGGLFSADGLLIGVCNAAVPTDNEGLYAALAAIHSELDQAELSFVSRSGPDKPGALVAIAAAETPTMPKRMPPPSDLVRLTEGPREPTPRRAPEIPSFGGIRVPKEASGEPVRTLQSPTAPDPATLRPDEKAALEEIQRKTGEGAELICIIRSRTNPQARSEIIVLDRVSPAFIQRLTTEPGQNRSSHGANAGSESPPSAMSPPAESDQRGLGRQGESPLHETSATEGWGSSPESEWRPRWLERGYQGS